MSIPSLVLAFVSLCLTGLGATTNVIPLTTFQYPHGKPQNSWAYRYASATVPAGSIETFDRYWYDQVNDPEITNYLGQFAFDDSVFEDFMATNAGGYFGVGFERTSSSPANVC